MQKENIESTNGELPELTQAEGCVHHWVIETPNGPTSPGVCKTCCVQRSFSNVTDNDFNHKLVGQEGRNALGYLNNLFLGHMEK